MPCSSWIRYQAKSHTAIYRSKMPPVFKRNFEIFPALDWLAALTALIVAGARNWRREGLKVPQKQPKRGRLWLTTDRVWGCVASLDQG